MEETFDSFTKRPPIYYIIYVLIAIFFLLVVISFNLDLPQIYIDISVILMVGTILIKLIFLAKWKMYIKDGELKISPDEININSTRITLNDIKRIEIKISDYPGRTKGGSDGSGNSIEITDKYNVLTKCSFVLVDRYQYQRTKEIVAQWKAHGISVESLLF